MHNNYILKILEFQGSDIEFTQVENVLFNGVDTICIYAQKKQNDDEIITCPDCGSASIYKKSFYYRTIRHLNAFKSPCIVKLKQRRFECKDCGKTFNEKIDFVKKHCRISNDVKTAIIDECRRKQSFVDVANRLNISTRSVESEFDQNVAIDRLMLTKAICIDEFKANTEYGKYALIIGDPDSGEILDILPKRTHEFLFYYFNKLDKAELNIVKYYITDLFESYRTIHRVFFPDSMHIVDRFHWIKLATNAFNNTRIREMNYYKIKASNARDEESKRHNGFLYTLLKKYHKVFIKNRYKCELAFFDEESKTMINNKYVTFQDIIEFALNNNDDLKNAYFLLQDLYKISVESTYETYLNDISKWYNSVDESNNRFFKSVKNTYKYWKTEIRNSFFINPETYRRLSNGFIEGKNNYCKVVKRIAFGFKKFSVIRNRILYENNKNLTIQNKEK